jgi:DNA polymerase V
LYTKIMKKWTGLLDCNNFFVSCERLFRPDLIGQPVLVLSSNDGCVVARSQEIKDMGIPMGAPYFKVKDILKTNKATVFSGNHSLYRDISKRVFASMSKVANEIEQYSVDEAFFHFSGTEEEVIEFARLIKDKVEQQTGVPVSIGIAASKTLAKVANSYAKKGKGIELLDEIIWEELQKTYELASVWGIGKQLSIKCRKHGLITVRNFLETDTATISKLFGVVGERLRSELSGVPTNQKGQETKQSILSSRSFAKTIESQTALEEAIAYHVESVTCELRQLGLVCGSISVFISPGKHSDFALQGQVADCVFDIYTNDTNVILREAIRILRTVYRANIPYKKAGVRISRLAPVKAVQQLTLFSDVPLNNLDSLQEAIDGVNQKFTKGRVHIGFLEGKRLYKPQSSSRSPAYTKNWQDLAVVKAE